jgi:transcriptional regulator with XRE-family HTH domain
MLSGDSTAGRDGVAGEVRRLARPHDPVEAHIGARLRTARQAAGLTLAAVAEQAGLTKGFLSRLERDEVSPSVASLVTVCGVLGIGVGTLFEAPETSLVRAGEAPAINFGGRGLHEYLLTAGSQRQLQVIRSIVEPGGGGGPELYALACDVEFVYVVAGQLRLMLPGEMVDLAVGDAFTMPGTTPHTWLNPSTTAPAEVLWALTPAP